MLHIQTPVYRTEHLEKIYQSISKYEDVTWHLSKSKHTPPLTNSFLKDERVKIYEIDCLDSDTVSKRNVSFDEIEDGYFILIDDDTLFLEAAYLVYRKHFDQGFKGIIVGHQKYGSIPLIFRGPVKISSTDPAIIELDTGMAICYFSVLDYVRWVKDENCYNDTFFWRKCLIYFGAETTIFTDETISYYNYFGAKVKFRKEVGSYKIKFDIRQPILVFLYLRLRIFYKLYKILFRRKPTFKNEFPENNYSKLF